MPNMKVLKEFCKPGPKYSVQIEKEDYLDTKSWVSMSSHDDLEEATTAYENLVSKLTKGQCVRLVENW